MKDFNEKLKSIDIDNLPNLTEEQKAEIDRVQKEWKDKFDSMTTYTWEELNRFKEEGVEGRICICSGMKLMNSMMIECIHCGNVLPEYAKHYIERRKKNEC